MNERRERWWVRHVRRGWVGEAYLCDLGEVLVCPRVAASGVVCRKPAARFVPVADVVDVDRAVGMRTEAVLGEDPWRWWAAQSAKRLRLARGCSATKHGIDFTDIPPPSTHRRRVFVPRDMPIRVPSYLPRTVPAATPATPPELALIRAMCDEHGIAEGRRDRDLIPTSDLVAEALIDLADLRRRMESR
jgi:hypothetical protein